MKKRHMAKRCAGLFLAFALAASLICATDLTALAASDAAAAEETVVAASETDETVTLSGGETITEGGSYCLAADATGVITISTTDKVEISGNGAEYNDDLQMTSTPNEKLYFSATVAGINLTLSDMFISDTSADVPLLDLTGEGNILTIEGTVVLDMDTGYNLNAAIHVGPDTSLTVNGSGTLYLYKNTQGAGFGGNSGEVNGTITFGDSTSSLKVFAKGTKQGALIGAGASSSSSDDEPGSVSFVEGAYNLISNSRGAVIGGSAGSRASSGTTVYVGTKANININVDYSGAAVGGGGYDGGNDSSGGTLYVSGGSLRCYIDQNAAGNTTGWNGNGYTAGVNDAAITAQRLNGNGEAVYWSAFNTTQLEVAAESFEVYVDGSLFYSGGLPEYGFVQEGLDKGEQLSITSTVSNWYKNGETNLYFYLTGENHSITVNGESFTCIWNSETESFTYYKGAANTYDVTGNFENVTSSGSGTAWDVVDYTATLTADEDYLLPDSITVTVGGSELVSGEGYVYDAESGSLTIYAAYITGDIGITAVGVATHSVSMSLTGISSDGADKVAVEADYTATLTADEYFVLPESITVTVGESELVSGEGYAYDAESGSVTVYAAYITGDIEITAEGVATSYSVSTSLTGLSSDGDSRAAVGSDYTATLTTDAYYVLPGSITVTVGGSELVSGEGYVYDAESGSLTIYAAYITGDIEITAVGTAPYSVSMTLSDISSDGAGKVAVGSDYTATLTADTYYVLPGSITVTVGGSELVSGEGYVYDAESGSLTIYAAYITGDIDISAAGVLSVDLNEDEDGYLLLYTESDILTFADVTRSASAAGLNARLMADITVSADSGFTGIGTSSTPYAGTFDGNDHTVTLSLSTAGAAGLFAYVSGATIEDVTTAGTVASSVNTYGCAGLVSYVMTNGVTIRNCVNQADVSGAGYVAGLVGRCSGSSVSVTVADSSNEGSITASGSYAGGIAAYIRNGSISGCVNYGAVSGTTYNGGIAGYAYSNSTLEISECGNEGTVTGSGGYTGGIAGIPRGSSSAPLTMDSLYNAGTVSGTTYVGGIAGRSYASLSNAYNAGTVSGTAVSTGGLVGNNYLKSTVLSNAYNAGEVTYTSSGVTYAGGLLVGSITSSSYLMYADNTYYLSTLDGSAVASGSSYLYSYSTQAALTDDELAAMAKTSDEMTALAETLGDSFATNTDSDYHLGYPVLTWEETGDDAEELQIITQPEDYTGIVGSTAVFEVEATGSSLTYQWQYLNSGAVTWRDSSMSGADTASISVTVTEARDGQQYRCVVTDGDGNTVTSDAATLTISEAGFSITLQPSDYTGLVGSTATFTVEADGTGLTYQWQYLNAGAVTWKDSGLTDAATETISVTVTEARDGQQYRCIVTDENGNSVTSEAATLSLPSAGSIVITAQPSDYTGAAGDTATFTVEAEGNGLTYQWQYLNAGAVTWKDSGMTGAATATLSVDITDARDGQQYRCVITDEDGNMAVSDAVTLSVE